jgi:hypothetical protein
MRRHRERRRKQFRRFGIKLRQAEIGMLIRNRLLTADNRDDNAAVLRAFYQFLDDTLR